MSTSEVHTPISAEELAHAFEEETPGVDLTRLRRRGLADAGAVLAHGAGRLLAVLHPLRPQQLLRLDRGDRHQLSGGHRLHGLGDVRPSRASTSRSICSSTSCRAGMARALATLIDIIRTAFFAYAAYLVWTFMSLIEGKSMTDRRPAEEPGLLGLSAWPSS